MRKSKIFSPPKGNYYLQEIVSKCNHISPAHTQTQREADVEGERAQDTRAVRRESVQASGKVFQGKCHTIAD